MLSIIINRNGASESRLQNILEAAGTIDNNEILLVTETSLEATGSQITTVWKKDPASSVLEAISRASKNYLLYIDANLTLSAQQIEQLAIEMSRSPQSGAIYTPLQTGNEIIELPSVNIPNMVSIVAKQSTWPLLCIGLRTALLTDSEKIEGRTVQEILAKLLILAAVQRESVDQFQAVEVDAGLLRECELPTIVQADVLSYLVNSCNIEDLFPTHDWINHEEEAAAACYHTLAATFIRLGDLDTAKQCLSFSDRLEDSPRSLALKALISLSAGETLGAVANMVSSLQQYEVRKTNEGNRHYLTFSPIDLESVNSSLHAGLSALNQRDNQTALEHFAEAVFNFDNFYSENGVDGLLN